MTDGLIATLNKSMIVILLIRIRPNKLKYSKYDNKSYTIINTKNHIIFNYKLILVFIYSGIILITFQSRNTEFR